MCHRCSSVKMSNFTQNKTKYFKVNVLRVTIPFAFDTVKLVLETISKSPKLSKEQIAVQIGKSRATVTRALATLVRLDKIRRVGSDKNGHWEIIQ